MIYDILNKISHKKIKFAEIGVHFGETTLKVCSMLTEGSEVHIFDRENVTKKVGEKIKKLYKDKIIVKEFGVTEGMKPKNFGSGAQENGGHQRGGGDYNWDLIKLVEQQNIKYDYVYLDGAHELTIDGLAFFLVDKLLKINGYIEFDDYGWTMGISGTCSPYPPVNNTTYAEKFTEEQINTPHIKLIVDNLVKTDNRYKEIVANRIYQKIK